MTYSKRRRRSPVPSPLGTRPFDQTPNIASRGFRESIKGCGVVDQDGRARCRVWRPFRQQVEEDRIVRLFLLRRMRPVARPHHPLSRGFNVGAGNRHRVGVGRRADLAVLIGASLRTTLHRRSPQSGRHPGFGCRSADLWKLGSLFPLALQQDDDNRYSRRWLSGRARR